MIVTDTVTVTVTDRDRDHDYDCPQAVGAVGPWGQLLDPEDEVQEQGEAGAGVQEAQEAASDGHLLSKSSSADSAVEATEDVVVVEEQEEEKENLAEGQGALNRSKADCDKEKLSEVTEEVKDRRSFAEITIQ